MKLIELIDIHPDALPLLKSIAKTPKIKRCNSPIDMHMALESEYGKIISFHQLAGVIAKEFGFFVHLHSAKKSSTRVEPDIYFYEDGIYKVDGQGMIDKITNALSGITTNGVARASVRQEIIFHIDTYKHTEFEEDKKFICCNNGILDINTLTLTMHSPNRHFITKIPVNWNPNATCPEFEQFLHEVLLGRKQRFELTQEAIGLCLYRGIITSNPAFFILYGGGRNGKSTFLDAIGYLLGNENCNRSNILEILTDSTTKMNLFGKLANLSGENKLPRGKDTEVIKSISAGDAIEGREIYGFPWKFKPYCTLIFSFNDMPVIEDNCIAMNQRINIIEFPNSYLPSGKNTDPNKLQKITTKDELEGMFVFAVKGLRRVVESGKFSRIEDNDEIYEYMVSCQDTVAIWAEDNLEFSDGEYIIASEAYNLYKTWGTSKGLQVVSSAKFGEKLLARSAANGGIYDEATNPCYRITKARKRLENDNREYVYVNIRMKKSVARLPTLESEKVSI